MDTNEISYPQNCN